MGCGETNQQVQPMGADIYERKQLIGVGSYGCCYSATHKQTNGQYAMKVIDKCSMQALISQTPSLMKLNTLSHPQLVGYKHIEVKDNALSVVMEFAVEGSLRKKKYPLEEAVVGKIAGQILDGLRYLHCKDMLHYDIKPANVLLFSQGVKLSDYGLAMLCDDRLGSHRGTVFRENSERYMAPEVYKHLGYSKKADIWSLGCMVVEMLCGKQPWSEIHQNMEVVMKEITKDVLPRIQCKCSRECEQFIKMCLNVIPSQRGSAEELRWHPFITTYYQTEEVFKPESKEQKTILNNTNDKVSTKKGYNKNRNKRILTQGIEVQKIHQTWQNQQNEQNEQNGVIAHIEKGLLKAKKREQIQHRKKEKLLKLSTTIQQISNDYMKMTQALQGNKSRRIKHSIGERFNTQHSLLNQIVIQFPQDNQYMVDKESVKKPLRLLHKKIRQKKLRTEISKNMSMVKHSVQENQSKIRIQTENNHDNAIIDTMAAREERDRYINQQLFFKKQREEQNKKWEVELKKGADIIRKESQKRYEYTLQHEF